MLRLAFCGKGEGEGLLRRCVLGVQVSKRLEVKVK
jgi:hypothetical protein